MLRFTNACRPRSTAPSQFGPSGRPCFPYHRRRCVQCRAIWRSFLRPSVQQQRDRTCRTSREAGGVRPRSASPWQVVLGADAFEVVSHRGAFRDAFLLVLPGMAASDSDEELAEEASGMAPSRSSCSTILMIAGVAEPPNLPLNFTPFQLNGLWLDVMTTPPAAPIRFTE